MWSQESRTKSEKVVCCSGLLISLARSMCGGMRGREQQGACVGPLGVYVLHTGIQLLLLCCVLLVRIHTHTPMCHGVHSCTHCSCIATMQQRQVRPNKSASGVELVYIVVLNTAAVCAAPFVYLSSVSHACTRACTTAAAAAITALPSRNVGPGCRL